MNASQGQTEGMIDNCHANLFPLRSVEHKAPAQVLALISLRIILKNTNDSTNSEELRKRVLQIV